MTRHVAVGADGSAESIAAVSWAAQEAMLRAVPLLLVHVEETPAAPETPPDFARAQTDRTENLLRDAAGGARSRYPGLEVATDAVQGRAADALIAAADRAEALGSGGLGRAAGFLTGSASLPVVAKSRKPVVLVRSRDAAEPPRQREAPGEAARRGEELRVVHSWSQPAAYAYAAIMDPGIGVELEQRVAEGLAEGLADMFRPWRSRFTEVNVTERTVNGPAAAELIHASEGAALLVVGRRSGGAPTGPHLGHVAQSAIHHSGAPVAVVPHE
ncbi:universal stress protein [Streptomyces sp. NBC_00342]|uniref:universal stress protein n=1 Tax=Streptomyces sp. NBC_00342 TaxID=2975718 RepID=UPI002E2DFEBD|nr:universal stress protein [Streptomyces sp. NBC_00342]